jgi:hypothetical protein
LEYELKQEKDKNFEISKKMSELQNNNNISNQTQKQQLVETKEILGIKERDLEIERKQRQRAEKKAAELELKIFELEKINRNVEEWRRADELKGKMDKEEMRIWMNGERVKMETQQIENDRKLHQLKMENERIAQEAESLRKEKEEQAGGVKDLIEKLNEGNRQRKILEDSSNQLNSINVSLRKQCDELGVINNAQQIEINSLKEQIRVLKQNYEQGIRMNEEKMQMEKQKHLQVQETLQNRIRDLEVTVAQQKNTYLTSLSKIHDQPKISRPSKGPLFKKNNFEDLKKRVVTPEPLKKNESVKATISYALEPQLSKVIVNNKVVFEQDIKPDQFSAQKKTLSQNESLKSLSQFNFSNKKKISLTDLSLPKKNVKYSITDNRPNLESQNNYFRLNRTFQSGTSGRVGRSVSPSPIRRIKLEDRKNISSQQPNKSRGYTSRVYSSLEKNGSRFNQNVKVDPTPQDTNYLQRRVGQAVRISRNGGSSGQSEEIQSSNDYYYVTKNPGKGSGVRKVGDILHQIKTNIEQNNFKSEDVENDKYEISELSSFAQSQLPREHKQNAIEVYNLNFSNEPQGQPGMKKIMSQNDLPEKNGNSSYRFTKKKMQTSPQFGNIGNLNPSTKTTERMGKGERQIIHTQSEFGSDEENEMNFMIRNEEEMDTQFEIFKNKIKRDFRD